MEQNEYAFPQAQQREYTEAEKAEALSLLVRAGICTPDGELVEYYRS